MKMAIPYLICDIGNFKHFFILDYKFNVMEDIVTRANLDKFRVEMNTFKNLTGQIPTSSISLDFSDYLRWCEVQRLDKLLQIIEKR